jgi:DASS family divalent anion:Na+ symporter
MSAGPAGSRLGRWAAVIGVAAIPLVFRHSAGIPPRDWDLLAIFVATIVGLAIQPIPGGAMVLLGVTASVLFGVQSVNQALAGYADPIVWLVLAAFAMSRGMIKTGLGRRIAFLFIRAIGRRSLGLGFSLVLTDFVLAAFIPSNAARAGGIVFPIAKSIAEAYDSRPGPSARRLGSFLMLLLYLCGVVICAIFLTGQAANPLIASFAKKTAGIDLGYAPWLAGAIVPGLVSLAVVALLVYRLHPPEVRDTPHAVELARAELTNMGPMSDAERRMLGVFALVCVLWMTASLHHTAYAAVALLGICTLLLTGVLDWEDVKAERGAWDVFIWYGGLVQLAGALGDTQLTSRFAQSAAGLAHGGPWWGVLLALLLAYFFAHYLFASITAHATAMYVPFLAVLVAAKVPPVLAALSLAYVSNLMAGLTHYGTTPGPIYFGAGYVSQATWWRVGWVTSVVSLVLFMTLGAVWWKAIGRW